MQKVLAYLEKLEKENPEEYERIRKQLFADYLRECLTTKQDEKINILDLLVKYKIALTKSEAKRLVLMGVIQINGMVYNGISDHIFYNKTKFLIIKKGNIEYRILHDKVEVIK